MKLRENSSDTDIVYVRVHIPGDYFDKYGNPVGMDKYDARLEEIDNILFNCGAEAEYDYTCYPEDGPECDDIDDTGWRKMTVAQLRNAVNSGIDESEIQVYTNHDMDEMEYLNLHPEVNPFEDSYDPWEDSRIYDINSLIYDSDDYVEGLAEKAKRLTKQLLEARASEGNETKEDVAKRMGVSVYMKRDVERIFEYNPDMSESEFYKDVCGEGDEGYDEECTAAMWEYYQFLQDIN